MKDKNNIHVIHEDDELIWFVPLNKRTGQPRKTGEMMYFKKLGVYRDIHGRDLAGKKG